MPSRVTSSACSTAQAVPFSQISSSQMTRMPVLAAVLDLGPRVHPAGDPDQDDRSPGSKPASTARVIGQQWLSFSPPTSGAVSRWVSTGSGPGSRGRARHGAQAAGIVTECSPPRVTGSAPARRISSDVGLRALEGHAPGSPGDTSQSPQSTGREDIGDVEVEHRVVGEELAGDVAHPARAVVGAGAADRWSSRRGCRRSPRRRPASRSASASARHVREAHERARQARMQQAGPHRAIGRCSEVTRYAPRLPPQGTRLTKRFCKLRTMHKRFCTSRASGRFAADMGEPMGIKEVAAAAGVSITTVSHALNGKGRLPERPASGCARWRSSSATSRTSCARKLAGGRTGLLALRSRRCEDLAFQLGDFDYFCQPHHGTRRLRALDRGYALAIAPAADASRGPCTRSAARRRDRRRPGAGRPVGRSTCGAQGVPIVTTGRILDGPDDALLGRQRPLAGIRGVLDHLADAGARRIALLTPPPFASYVVDARGGYSPGAPSAASGAGGRERPRITESGGFEAAIELLDAPRPARRDLRGARPARDRRPAGGRGARASRARTACGSPPAPTQRRQPRARPPLTALGLNPEQIGREAVDLLIDAGRASEPPERHRIVPATVIPRASTVAKARSRRRR